MDNYITPERIANSILQDNSYAGYYILVEGQRDVRVYKRFISGEAAKVKVTFGKEKLREVYGLLTQREFDRKIGIRDADFLRIKGNPKYSENFSDPIFVTDGHDAEMMMVAAGVVRNYFVMIGADEKLDEFERLNQKTVVELIFSLIRPLGYLRLANKRFNLGLAFKPPKLEGNPLKIEKFVDEKKWVYRGDDIMVNTVYEYSNNRGRPVESREILMQKLKEVMAEDHPSSEVCNGHDFSYVLHMFSKRGVSSGSGLLSNYKCVEDLLASQFDWIKFSGTDLFAKIWRWQNETGNTLFDHG